MKRIRTMTQRPKALAHYVDAGRALAAMVTLGLVMTVCLAVAGVLRAGIAPAFDQHIVLDAQHRLLIHNGASPICVSIPNPPQHDCFRPGLERREFAVDYLTPGGVQSLIWFRLPPR